MHYHAEVWIKNPQLAEEQITRIMQPFEEGYIDTGEVDEDGEPIQNHNGGFWDWWQIGGRWSGSHDGYNPEKNPRNNKGGMPVWPTEFENHYGDVLPVSECRESLTAHTLIIDGVGCFHTEEWNGSEIVKTDWSGNVKAKLAELGIEGGYLVTVDYHN